jgi:hypothetical protein
MRYEMPVLVLGQGMANQAPDHPSFGFFSLADEYKAVSYCLGPFIGAFKDEVHFTDVAVVIDGA